MAIKINLVSDLQEKKKTDVKVNTVSMIAGITILGLTVVTVLFFAISTYISGAEILGVNRNISDLKEDLKPYKELEEAVVSLNNGLETIKKLSNGENRWTALLPHLEQATPKEVIFKRLKLTKDGIEADLQAKSVDAMGKFIQSYKNYEAIVVKGSGDNKYGMYQIDDQPPIKMYIKPDGNWTVGLPVDLTKNHEIKFSLSDKSPDQNTQENQSPADQANTSTDQSANNTENQKSTTGTPKIQTFKITYTGSADKKQRKIDVGAISGTTVTSEIKKLFSEVDTNEYTRDDAIVKFTANFKFDAESIW